jgi:DNA-directed RNA polymerase beta subunit
MEKKHVYLSIKTEEAAIKTNCVDFNTYYPGKILLRDGTGEYFDNPITVGKSYI